jgi:hypothetical protein
MKGRELAKLLIGKGNYEVMVRVDDMPSWDFEVRVDDSLQVVEIIPEPK